MRKGAGTLSNVNFILSGDESDTGIRTLSDGVRKVCKSVCTRAMLSWTYFQVHFNRVYFMYTKLPFFIGVCNSKCK